MVPSETLLNAEKTASVQADTRMMKRALELAAKGVGQVSPGPLVGCVITDKNIELVGEGYYVYDGLRHAETIALEQAGSRAKGGIAYVSLEPHAHHGRTPPCTNALIEAGITRVVAPIEDPNPQVSGKGFAHLRSVGIAVSVGLMQKEAAQLNERYIHFMRTGRPFVHLKLAVSLDGKIATRTGDSRWIAGEEARQRAHEFRHQSDAILVGAGTVGLDDPLLTDRSLLPRRRPLTRIVLDNRSEIRPESQLVRTANEAPVLVFTASTDAKTAVLKAAGVELINEPAGGRNILEMLTRLGERSIQSVLVEGGSKVAGAFIDSGLVNKVTFFIAPVIVGGATAPSAIAGSGFEKMKDALRLQDVSVTQLGADIEITGYVA